MYVCCQQTYILLQFNPPIHSFLLPTPPHSQHLAIADANARGIVFFVETCDCRRYIAATTDYYQMNSETSILELYL